MLNTATTVGSNGRLVYGIPYGAKMISGNSTDFSYSLRGQLNVNKSWKDFSAECRLQEQKSVNKPAKIIHKQRYGFDKDAYSSATWNPTVPYETVIGLEQYPRLQRWRHHQRHQQVPVVFR